MALFQRHDDPDWTATLGDCLPALTRGSTHGDLHGRNVLVGLYDGLANFPVVFDYEHTGTGKLPGWDFIKLETETRVRALDAILPTMSIQRFGCEVVQFEKELWQRTEQLAAASPLTSPNDSATALDRLAFLILTIRQSAAASLGPTSAGGNWIEEYRFLITLYVVAAAKYGYTDRQRLALLIGAGVGLADAEWHRRMVMMESRRWDPKEISSFDETFIIGWEAPLQAARELRRSAGDLSTAKSILERLVSEFPHVPSVWEELVLVCLDLGEEENATQLLARALEDLNPTEELLCRFGRIDKDRGNDRYEEENWPVASFHYERAIKVYEQAFDLNFGHYPGINLAAVHLYHACALRKQNRTEASNNERSQARTVAAKLLETREQWPTVLDDDSFWHLATEAEAHMIVGNAEKADRTLRPA